MTVHAAFLATETERIFGLAFPPLRDELKTAYRRVAFETHPDRGGNAVTCEKCAGEGWTQDTRYTYARTTQVCFICFGQSMVCRRCDSDGRFTLKNGRKVICRDCNGTKRSFYPSCPFCNQGYQSVSSEKTVYLTCRECGGTGQIEILNPALPLSRFGGKSLAEREANRQKARSFKTGR